MKRHNRKGTIMIGIMLDMVFWATVTLLLISLAA